MEATTLKDIALELGISITTVSKALNNYPDISKATKNLVISTARKMNYSPNEIAVNLRKQETKTIGVIIPTMVHHFFSKVIDGIIEKAEKEGYLVILLQSNERISLEKLQVNLLINKRVDGILMSLSNQTKEIVHLKKIINNDIPLVLFDKIETSLSCSKVRIDDKLAAYEAVNHLIEKGYRRIAHFRGGSTPQNSRDRFEGYKKALLNADIPFDDSLVYTCDNNEDFNDGYENAQKLIQEHKDIDAVFAVTDVVAIGIIKYLNEQKIAVPGKIAVCGFSNWFMSSVVTPSLTTVHQPAHDIGAKAAELLLNEIDDIKNNTLVKHKHIILPTYIIKREST